jgi:hypothetical protein
VTQGIVAAPPPQLPYAAGTPAGAMPTTGRWGWYQDHDGAIYRRTSTLVKEVETDNRYLDLWKLRQVAEGMSVRDDLVLALKAMGRPPAAGWTREQKKQIDELVETAMQAAKTTDGATTGTAMHTLTERVDRGEPLDAVAAGLPATAAQSLRAYAHLRELNGWRTVEVERTVVVDELEVAGTFDRVDYLPELAPLLGPGTCQYGHVEEGDHFGGWQEVITDLPVIVDVKTEKDPTKNGLHIGPQLAIYSRARRMWRPTGGTHDLVRNGQVVRYQSGDAVQVPNGEYVPAPCVRQDVAVVVHVGDGDANPLLVNLSEGWAAAVAAYEQINRKSRASRKVGAAGAWFVPLPTKRASRLSNFVETAAAARYADPNRPGPGQVAAAGQEAVRGPDGMVRWEDRTAAEMMGLPGAADPPLAGDADPLGETRRQLIDAIWQARTVDGLGILWNMARDRGVPWAGPVAMAGDARRRQIECVQRALHAGGGKCACGWVAGQIA